MVVRGLPKHEDMKKMSCFNKRAKHMMFLYSFLQRFTYNLSILHRWSRDIARDSSLVILTKVVIKLGMKRDLYLCF